MDDSDDTRGEQGAEEERAKREEDSTKPSDAEARRKQREALWQERREARNKQLEALREERRRQRQAGRRASARPNDDEERRKRRAEALRRRPPRRPKPVDYYPHGDQPIELAEEDEAIIAKMYAELSLAFFAETKVEHARVSEALEYASGAEREALLKELARHASLLEAHGRSQEQKAAARAEAARRAAEE